MVFISKRFPIITSVFMSIEVAQFQISETRVELIFELFRVHTVGADCNNWPVPTAADNVGFKR